MKLRLCLQVSYSHSVCTLLREQVSLQDMIVKIKDDERKHRDLKISDYILIWPQSKFLHHETSVRTNIGNFYHNLPHIFC